MRNILVTGGAGFIGSALAKRLIKEKDNFIVIADDLSTGSVEKLPDPKQKNWKFIKCDLNNYRDISEVMLSFNFDFVFHYAAVVGVQRTLDNPVSVLKDIEGIKNILNIAKNHGTERIFFSSSSEVYGEPVDLPQNELTTPLNSRLPYAVVKNLGEAFLRSYKREFNLNYTIFRLFNTYGPDQSIDFVMSKFIRLAIRNEDINVYGDGTQARTFCFIDDHIDSTVNAFQNDLFVNDVVNIGSDVEVTIKELAALVIDITNSKSTIVHVDPLPEGDMLRRLPDITNMKKLLNRDLTPISEGIKKVLESGKFSKESLTAHE
ncbi:MAG: NAD-dependent epimerase/dehydratase family protein [Bacteroidetes bacterium]|nr:NAD-dependent epimerase/dehydratase family protein [Bacteroidota bacterium]